MTFIPRMDGDFAEGPVLTFGPECCFLFAYFLPSMTSIKKIVLIHYNCAMNFQSRNLYPRSSPCVPLSLDVDYATFGGTFR